MTRLLVQFSCGAASACAAKLACLHYADEFEIIVVYQDVFSSEHPDNRRFLADVEEWIGQPVVILKSPKYNHIHEVFRGERYLRNRYGSPCTKILKRAVSHKFQRPDDTIVLGFTVEERARAAEIERNNHEVDFEWILIDRDISKPDCMAMLENAGIPQPAMYGRGFKNNNCIGCVKGGAGYWSLVRREFPERFAEMAQIEREIGHSILRLTTNGALHPVYLDELPADYPPADNEDLYCVGLFCEQRAAELKTLIE